MELFSPPVYQRYIILKMPEPGGWIDSQLSAAMIILEAQDSESRTYRAADRVERMYSQ